MKKLIIILTAVFFILAVTGCGPVGEEGEKETRKFWANNFKKGEFYQLDAEKLAENSRCIVWAEVGSGVTEATANSMASAYNTVYAKMMNTFGWEIDDDEDDEDELYKFGGGNLNRLNTMEIAHYIISGETSNAKLTILLLDIKDNYSATNRGYTAGYFHSLNFKENEHSNKLDMIYVDINPGKPGSPDSNRTLAHEMQHLMNFVTSIVRRYDEDTDNINLMDIWIDEGLSTAAEWLYDEPEDRISWFNNNGSGSMKGKINEGNNFYVWDDHLDDYATAYIFFQYLRLQSKKPDKPYDIYFDILTSKSYNYKAVITAKSINNSHKNKWETLLGDWFAANYINAPSGLYGYMNDSKLKNVKAPMFPKTDTTVNLFPGEGVYSKISGTGGGGGGGTTTVPGSSGKIRYKGFNSSGDPVASGDPASGAWLTYNIDTDDEGLLATASGKTTGVASSVDISMSIGSSSLQIASYGFSEPYVVDANYFLRENQKRGRSANGIRSAVVNDGENAGKSNIPKIGRAKLKRVIVDE